MSDKPTTETVIVNDEGDSEFSKGHADRSTTTSPDIARRPSALGALATRMVFAIALMASAGAPACKCDDGTEVTVDVLKYAEELKKIAEIQEYFEANKDRLKSMEKRAVQHPWGVAKEVEEVTGKLNELIPALQNLGKSSIKLNPEVLLEVAWHINTTKNLLGSRAMKDFHWGAKQAREHRRSRAVINWILKKIGITDINGLIKLSSELKKLRRSLVKTIKGMDSLTDADVQEYSSDYAVNRYLKSKPPKTAKKRGKNAELQRKLIDKGCLHLWGYDGIVGRGTRRAQARLKQVRRSGKKSCK